MCVHIRYVFCSYMNVTVTAILGETSSGYRALSTLTVGTGKDPGPKPEPGFETGTSRLGLCCGACFGSFCSPQPLYCHNGQEGDQESGPLLGCWSSALRSESTCEHPKQGELWCGTIQRASDYVGFNETFPLGPVWPEFLIHVTFLGLQPW